MLMSMARDVFQERAGRWNFVQRKLKLAEERVHVNSDHPLQAEIIRALRLGNAKRARSSSRVRRPKIPKPTQLLRVDQFNVLLTTHCFEGEDAEGNNYELLGIFCCGTNCFVVCVLEDTHENPKAAKVRKYCVNRARWSVGALLRHDAVEALDRTGEVWQRSSVRKVVTMARVLRFDWRVQSKLQIMKLLESSDARRGEHPPLHSERKQRRHRCASDRPHQKFRTARPGGSRR